MSDRLLLWDFDGTLAHRPGRWRGALSAALERHHPGIAVALEAWGATLQSGFPWHRPDITHRLGPDDWWQALGPTFARALAAIGDGLEMRADFIETVREEYLSPQAWHTIEGALEVLEQLRSVGWRHVIISNHVPELPGLVEAVGLAPMIEAVFSSATTGFEKPHPEAFRFVLRSVGADTAQWMIGDSFRADYVGALDAGVRNALLIGGERPSPDVRWVPSLEAVPDALAT